MGIKVAQNYGLIAAHTARAIHGMRVAALGLIGNRNASPDPIDSVLDWIDRAVQFADGANLAFSPRRGFAAPGLVATAESLARQRAALELTGEVARRQWGMEL